jgi:hypothetical protein
MPDPPAPPGPQPPAAQPPDRYDVHAALLDLETNLIGGEEQAVHLASMGNRLGAVVGRHFPAAAHEVLGEALVVVAACLGTAVAGLGDGMRPEVLVNMVAFAGRRLVRGADASSPFDPARITWTCHVCGEERPDQAIGVHTSHLTSPRGVALIHNVRYCTDRPGCAAGVTRVAADDFAHQVAHWEDRQHDPAAGGVQGGVQGGGG